MKFIGVALLAIIPFEIFLGISGMFFIEAAIAAVIVGGAVALANTRGLLPGTPYYEQHVSLESARASLELARINRTRTRINLLENQDFDKIKALEPGEKEV